MFNSIFDDKKEDLKVNDLLNATKEMAEIIDSRTNGMKKLSVKIDKGTEVDTAKIYFNLAKKPCYFNHELFGYLHRKNRLDFHYKIREYNFFKFKKEFRFVNEVSINLLKLFINLSFL